MTPTVNYSTTRGIDIDDPTTRQLARLRSRSAVLSSAMLVNRQTRTLRDHARLPRCHVRHMPQVIDHVFLRPAIEPPNAGEYEQAISRCYGITHMILRGKLGLPTEAAHELPIGIRTTRKSAVTELNIKSRTERV